jgi:hypothetical protein
MERSHFDHCARRSSPVEIPRRHRCPSTYQLQDHSKSPDMIFEMSPITSNFASPPSIRSFSQDSYDQEPFLYHFPVFSAHNVSRDNHLLNAPTRYHGIPISHVFTPTKNVCNRQRRTVERGTDENVPSFPASTTIIRMPPTTKIVGFSPALPTNCAQRNSAQASPPQDRLSPMPQSPVLLWSSWALTGENNGEMTSFDTDAVMLENYRLSPALDSDCYHFSSLQSAPSGSV